MNNQPDIAAYISPYLAAEDIPEGAEYTLTCASADIEPVWDPQSKKDVEKWVMRFRETPRALVLNKHRAKCMSHMFGTRTGAWVGKGVTLGRITVPAFGKRVGSIAIVGSPDCPATKVGDVAVTLGNRKTTLPVRVTSRGGARD